VKRVTPALSKPCYPLTCRANSAAKRGKAAQALAVVVIITTMSSQELLKRLEADGWTLRNVKGSHHVFKHPTKPGHISVPHPKKDLGVGLVNKLFKQAGLK
jgi:predicted RNA binding protein YcfA (HicA-like mRNA interferase family)